MPSIKAVSRVWSAVSVYVEAMSFLAALLCFFAFAVPQANASTFTDGLKNQAVTAILSIFGTDAATINSVAAVLSGTVGTVAVSTDASSPAYAVYAGGATGVTLGVYRVRATGENMTLTKLGLKLSSGNSGDLSGVELYNGGVLLGSASFAGGSTNATSSFVTPLSLPMDTDVYVTVKGSLSAIGTGQPGRSGDLVQVNASYFEAIGSISGDVVQGQAVTNVAGVRIFKSLPTVALDTISTAGLVDGRLIRFKVVANAAGSVSLGEFAFSIATSSANLSNISLFAYTDVAYALSVSGQGSLGKVGATVAASPDIKILPTTPLVIPAGATYYFELRASVAPTSPTPTVVTKLKGDATYSGIGQWAGQKELSSFTWSPNSTSTSAYTDNDWTNGYRILGLPATGIVQTRTEIGASNPIPPIVPAPTTTPPVATSTPTTTPVEGYIFKVTPTTGNAPLTVTASAAPSPRLGAALVTEVCGPIVVGTVVWGDGLSSALTRLGCSGNRTALATHTYTKAGTYTAKLIRSAPCAALTASSSCAVSSAASSVTITVIEGSAPSPELLTASPVSGNSPLKVIFSNWISSSRGSSNGYTIYFGDGKSEPAGKCRAPADKCTEPGKNTHVYTKEGTYTAKIVKENVLCRAALTAWNNNCSAETSTVAKIAITVNGKDKEKEGNFPVPVREDIKPIPPSNSSSTNSGRHGSAGSSEPVSTVGTSSAQAPAPSCALSANETKVKRGASVTLTWTSSNATSASSVDGGRNNKTQGSVTVKASEDTLYVKHVYGPGGEATCEVNVEVSGDNESGDHKKTNKKVVLGGIGDYFGQLVGTMQLGAVVVGETYAEFISGGVR